jgi:MFS family permease
MGREQRMTLAKALSYSANSISKSFGIFLAEYIANNAIPGTSTLAYSFVAGLSFSMSMFISPLATYSVGRYGTRVTLLIGVAIEFLGLITASFAKQYYQLLLSQGLSFGIGMGFLYVGTAGIVSQWFTKRRSLANGITAAGGSGFGGMVYSLSANAMIKKYGVPWTFRMLAIISGVINLLCTLLIRDRNNHIRTNQSPLDFKILKQPEFLLVQIYGVLTELGYVALLYSIPNFGNSIGLTSDQGATAGALLCLGQLFGRALVGQLGDSIGPINTTVLTTFITGLLALVWWPFADSYGVRLLDASRLSALIFSAEFDRILADHWAYRRYILGHHRSSTGGSRRYTPA